jgi:multiple sugar transport system ATP-binding protein
MGAFDLPAEDKAKAGDKVVLGVRPSDIRIAASRAPDVSAPVHLLEPLGDITVVSLGEGAQTLRIVLPESRASQIKAGDQLPVEIDFKRIHIFRVEDGVALR